MRRSCRDYTTDFWLLRRRVGRDNECTLMRSIAAFLALALGALLSGCFGSDKPMFALESAVRPLESGRYGLFEQYGDQSKPSEYMDIRLRDNVYNFVNEKGAVNPVTFHTSEEH